MGKTMRNQEVVLQELDKRGKMTLSEVIELLQVSESTARRLIMSMEKSNLLLRRFGGIQKLPDLSSEYSYAYASTQNEAQKKVIGSRAAQLVVDGDTIFMSAGSTIRQLAISLHDRINAGEVSELTVVTNSTDVLNILADNSTVVMIGGLYRKESNDVIGNMAERNIAGMHYTKAFLGADAIDLKEGVMTSDREINGVMETAKEHSAQTYVLVDSSKFGKTAFIRYAKLGDFAGIITDDDLSPDTKKTFQKGGAVFLD